MSIFAPVDQSGPDARRKALIQKLMQQAGAHAGAGAATAMPPSAAALGMATGFPFHGGRMGAAAPASTQSDNVASRILASLGLGGHGPLSSEASSAAGQAIDSQTGQVSDLHYTPHHVVSVAPPPVPPPVPTTALPPPITMPPVLPSGGDVSGALSSIALGGGQFYDPNLNILHTVPPPAPPSLATAFKGF